MSKILMGNEDYFHIIISWTGTEKAFGETGKAEDMKL